MNFTSKVTFSFPLCNSRHRPFSWFYCDFLSPLCPLSLTCRWSSCCTQHQTDPRTFWNGRLRESETMWMFYGVSNRFGGARMSLFSVCSRSATDWTLIKCPSLNWELGLGFSNFDIDVQYTQNLQWVSTSPFTPSPCRKESTNIQQQSHSQLIKTPVFKHGISTGVRVACPWAVWRIFGNQIAHW